MTCPMPSSNPKCHHTIVLHPLIAKTTREALVESGFTRVWCHQSITITFGQHKTTTHTGAKPLGVTLMTNTMVTLLVSWCDHSCFHQSLNKSLVSTLTKPNTTTLETHMEWQRLMCSNQTHHLLHCLCEVSTNHSSTHHSHPFINPIVVCFCNITNTQHHQRHHNNTTQQSIEHKHNTHQTQRVETSGTFCTSPHSSHPSIVPLSPLSHWW